MKGGGGGEGLRKFLDTRKEGSKKIVGLGEGLRKFVHFKTNTRDHQRDRMALISTQQFKVAQLDFLGGIPPKFERQLRRRE